MSQPLIIIDAQDEFLDTQHYTECIKEMSREIRLAKRRNDYILFVEYVNSRNRIVNKKPSSVPTIPSLLSLVKNYKKVIYVYKDNNDGGTEVLHTLRSKRIPRSNLRICGVYASFCVKDTAKTLAQELRQSKIYLMGKAIACYENVHKDKINALSELSYENQNVFIRN